MAAAPGRPGDPDEAAALQTVATAVLAAWDRAVERGLGVAAPGASLPQHMAVAAPLQQRQQRQVPQLEDWQLSPLSFVHHKGKTAIRQLAASCRAGGMDPYHPSVVRGLQARLYTQAESARESAAVERWRQLSEGQQEDVGRAAAPETVREAAQVHDADLRRVPRPTHAQRQAWRRRWPKWDVALKNRANSATLGGMLLAQAALPEARQLAADQRGAALEVCEKADEELRHSADLLRADLNEQDAEWLQQILEAARGEEWAAHRTELLAWLAAVPAGQLGDTEQRLAVRVAGGRAMSAGLLPPDAWDVRQRLWHRITSVRGGIAPRSAAAAAAGSECAAFARLALTWC